MLLPFKQGGGRYAYKMGTNFGISRIRMRERKKSRNISVGDGVSRDHVNERRSGSAQTLEFEGFS